MVTYLMVTYDGAPLHVLKIGMKKSMESKITSFCIFATISDLFLYLERFPPSGLLCVYCKLPSCHRSALKDTFDKHVSSMPTIVIFDTCLKIFH